MKGTAKLAGSWWSPDVPREGFTARAYEQLQRFQTSPFSLRSVSHLEGTALYAPTKKMSKTMARMDSES